MFERTRQYPEGNPNNSVFFSDDLTETGQISSVSVEAAQWVASIQATWRGLDGKTIVGPRHGSSHGDPVKRFDLAEGEYIKSVEGYSGKYVNFLKFTTSSGKTHEFGTAGGDGNKGFFVDGVMHGFFGYAAESLDCIGFFTPAHPKLG
jgi:Jacalin-like lectin domain